MHVGWGESAAGQPVVTVGKHVTVQSIGHDRHQHRIAASECVPYRISVPQPADLDYRRSHVAVCRSVHDALVKGHAEPDPRRLHEVFVQLGKRMTECAEKADDESWLIHCAACRQQREPAVTLLLQNVLRWCQVDLAECECENV